MNIYLRHYYRMSLFLSLVWREWEPKSCGIPDEYRIKYRIPASTAWQIASNIWLDVPYKKED